MSMTGKDRATLRSQAHHLDVKVHVGHAGITPSVVGSLDDVLRTQELVKCQVVKASDLSAKEAAQQLAQQLDAEVIQVIGRTFTLYREKSEES